MSNFFFKYKKIFVVLIIIVTVITIPLTVFISQKQQDIRQRASGEQIALYFAKGSNCSNRLINSFTLDGANTNTALSLCLESINEYAQGISGFNIILSAGNNLNFSSPTAGADADKIDITPLPQILDAGKTLRFTRINIDNNVMDSPLHLLSFTVTGTGAITTQTAEISSLMKADPLTVNKLISSLDINTAASAPAAQIVTAPTATPVPTATAVPAAADPCKPTVTSCKISKVQAGDFATVEWNAPANKPASYSIKRVHDNSLFLVTNPDTTKFEINTDRPNNTNVLVIANGVSNCNAEQSTSELIKCTAESAAAPAATATPTPTPRPGTPTPTPTQIPAGKTSANFKIALLGIVDNPKHINRKLTIEIFDPSMGNAKKGASVTTSIANNQPAKPFKGTSFLDAITKSGVYNILVKTDGYLKKLISVPITINGLNELPLVTLIPGDIDGDNKINLNDYNLFITCYGTKASLPTCDKRTLQLADFNDDIVIDGIDYNTFIKGLSVKEGDQL